MGLRFGCNRGLFHPLTRLSPFCHFSKIFAGFRLLSAPQYSWQTSLSFLRTFLYSLSLLLFGSHVVMFLRGRVETRGSMLRCPASRLAGLGRKSASDGPKFVRSLDTVISVTPYDTKPIKLRSMNNPLATASHGLMYLWARWFPLQAAVWLVCGRSLCVYDLGLGQASKEILFGDVRVI
jgi:hypothetical protein